MSDQSEGNNQPTTSDSNANQEQQNGQSSAPSPSEKKGGGFAPGCITLIIIAMVCGFIGQMGSLGMLLAVGLIAGCGILLFSDSHRNKAVEAAKIPSSVAKNIRIWLVVAGVFLIATIGQISDQKKATQEITEANSLWGNGEKAKAANLYESALSRSAMMDGTDRASVLEKLIEYHATEGSLSKAEKYCRDAIRFGTNVSLRGSEAKSIYDKAMAAHEAEKAKREAEAQSRKRQGADNVEAFVMAKTFVTKRLKSPKSASFGWQIADECVTDLGDGKFLVKGWVDAKNAFNAEIRSNWVVTVQYEGDDKWRLISINIR